MFDKLQERFESTFKKVRVNFKVAKDFLEKIREKAMGEEVLSSITPGQQFVKIVYDELCDVLGSANKPLDIAAAPPVPVMLIGLQGSGKTTTSAKLAIHIRKMGRKPLLVPSDIYRPAAIEQLVTLGKQINVPTFTMDVIKDPITICKEARIYAMRNGFDTMIIDTAGRLHIDENMVNELVEQKKALNPKETLLVLDAMTGQDAVSIAGVFNEKLGIDGIILTKLDGDTRGGAAISIKAVTGKPIKFIGVGEKLDALEPFFPDRLASRILGMGDVVSLVEKAQDLFDEKEARELERKFRKDEFTLEDFRDQIRQMKKMGSLESIIGMIPGMGKLKGAINFAEAEKDIKKTEAIINSMTSKERAKPGILDGSRRLRISKGSGTQVQDVNDLLKKYMETKKLLKKFTKGGAKGLQRQLFNK
ncbi:MAG: ffh [Deltaproteobacteria bacterium]|nr:ffh [Deltaproteobacteria bacterium]